MTLGIQDLLELSCLHSQVYIVYCMVTNYWRIIKNLSFTNITVDLLCPSFSFSKLSEGRAENIDSVCNIQKPALDTVTPVTLHIKIGVGRTTRIS